jgi:hypothetical protein
MMNGSTQDWKLTHQQVNQNDGKHHTKPSRVRFPLAGIGAHSVQVIQENERPLAAIALQAGVKIGPPRLNS